MDHEKYLLSAIISGRDLTPVSEANIKPEFFLDPNARSVFNLILSHKSMYGDVPSLSVIKENFPTYGLVKPVEPIGYYIDAIRLQHQLSIYEGGIRTSVEAFDKRDVKAVTTALSQTLVQVARDVPNTRDVDITRTGMDRMAEYLALKNLPDGMRGVPTGFITLDRATQGYQAGQLVTLVGLPKAGKSTAMLLSAMAAWMNGQKPVFFTFEMSNEEQVERLDAIHAGVSHHRLRNGTLLDEEWEKLEKSLATIAEMPPFFFSADTMATTTITGVQGKIDSLKPDIVFVDGVYLMDDEQGEPQRSPQALSHITTGFKRMAQNNEIPVAISTQALAWKTGKKSGLTGDSIGYSSSFLQDSDVVIGVESTDNDEINKMKILRARNCPPLEVFIHWNWATGVFEELKDDGISNGWGHGAEF